MSAWKIQGLEKRYRQYHALRGIDVAFRHDQITGILGVNGAGKSTLIKCMTGLIQTSKGTATCPEPDEFGYLPEQVVLPASVSARSLVAHALRLRGSGPEQADNLLAEVGLRRDVWTQKISAYSKGMRQRAAIAFALTGSPQWLILDEPMSGLDAVGRKRILSLLQARHSQGCGIIICSHIVVDLVRICDRILLLERGQIVQDITISDHSMDEAEKIEALLKEDSNA